MDGVEPRGRSCPIRGSEDGRARGWLNLGWPEASFGRTSVWDVVARKAPQELGAPTAHLTFSSWVWLSGPRTSEEPFCQVFGIYLSILIFLPLCWSRPLSVCFLNDFLSLPLSFSPPLYPPPPHLRLSGHLYLSIHLPQSPILPSPCGQGSDPSWCPLSLPQVSVCSPQLPSLWRPVGRRSPPAWAAAEPGSAGSLLGKHPRAGGTAPGRPAP